jgi:hypothetical protein
VAVSALRGVAFILRCRAGCVARLHGSCTASSYMGPVSLSLCRSPVWIRSEWCIALRCSCCMAAISSCCVCECVKWPLRRAAELCVALLSAWQVPLQRRYRRERGEVEDHQGSWHRHGEDRAALRPPHWCVKHSYPSNFWGRCWMHAPPAHRSPRSRPIQPAHAYCPAINCYRPTGTQG